MSFWRKKLLDSYDYWPKVDWPELATHVKIDERGCHTVRIQFFRAVEKENPYYTKLLAEYPMELANYKEILAKWKEMKKKFDDKMAETELDNKKRILAKLKEELVDQKHLEVIFIEDRAGQALVRLPNGSKTRVNYEDLK